MMTILIYVALSLATVALGLRLLAPSKIQKIKFYFKLTVVLVHRWVWKGHNSFRLKIVLKILYKCVQ